MNSPLFQPMPLGAISLSNRIVMAPMTRDRAGDNDVPTAMMTEYYRQRATAGLIVTEGAQPTPEGKGYWRTPGIHSQEQIDGWANIAQAVHGEGGKIIMQIMHCGRAVLKSNRGFDADIIAPSAVRSAQAIPSSNGTPTQADMPRAIESDECEAIIEQHAQAARNAIAAGLDGVELHCASGYLLNQFLDPKSNIRDDKWGGNIENRMRFPLATLQACADAIGANRVGFRIAPGNGYNDMVTENPETIFAPFIRAADGLGLAYLHVIHAQLPDLDIHDMVAKNWSGSVIINDSLGPDNASTLIENGHGDAVSLGRAFIANPDLVERMRINAPMTEVNRAFIYGGAEEGYIDYPKME